MTVPVDETFDWAAANERLRAAAEAAGESPPAWMPDAPGAEIVGLVVDVNPGVQTRHGVVPVVTLQGPQGGRRCVWLVHTALRRGFERAAVKLGEVVLVRYVGKVEREGAEDYHDYRVVVDRASSPKGVDWAAIAKRHGDDVALADEAEQQQAELEQQARELEPATPAPAAAAASDAALPGTPIPAVDDDIPF